MKHSKKQFQKAVTEELRKARKSHSNILTPHEGYAVILEEVDEFWTEVKKKTKNRNPKKMFSELVQIAAMAQRTAEDLL